MEEGIEVGQNSEQKQNSLVIFFFILFLVARVLAQSSIQNIQQVNVAVQGGRPSLALLVFVERSIFQFEAVAPPVPVGVVSKVNQILARVRRAGAHEAVVLVNY